MAVRVHGFMFKAFWGKGSVLGCKGFGVKGLRFLLKNNPLRFRYFRV